MNEIYKYRLKFTKTDKMRFIGHLDLLTYFQRAVKRARVPIAFSKGFNPHQLMSFAIPLPLGMASTAEYVDIQLDEPMDTATLKNALNAQMSLGMEILDVRKMEQGEDTGAALVATADHTIVLDRKLPDTDGMIRSLYADAEWLIEKVGKKKKVREVDIKPMVFSLKAVDTSDRTVLYTRIATGSNSNLKADLLLKYMYGKWGFDFDYYKMSVTRTQMYKTDENGDFSPL